VGESPYGDGLKRLQGGGSLRQETKEVPVSNGSEGQKEARGGKIFAERETVLKTKRGHTGMQGWHDLPDLQEPILRRVTVRKGRWLAKKGKGDKTSFNGIV